MKSFIEFCQLKESQNRWEALFNDKKRHQYFKGPIGEFLKSSVNFQDFLGKTIEHFGPAQTWKITGPHGYFDDFVLVSPKGSIAENSYEFLKDLLDAALSV